MSPNFTSNTLFGFLASFIGSFGSFAASVMVARLLGVEDSGIVNYVLWLVSLACAITDLGVYACLARYLPECTHSKTMPPALHMARYLLKPYAIVIFVCFSGFVGLALYVFVTGDRGLLGEAFEYDATKWSLIGGLYIAQAVSTFGLGYLHGMQNFRQVARIAAGSSIIRLITIAVCATYWGANGALIGYLAGTLLLTPIPFMVAFRGRKKPDLSSALKRRVLRFSGFSWAFTLASSLVVARPEIAFISSFWGAEAVGLYAAAFTIANLAIQGPLLLTSGLMPYFSQNSHPEGHLALQRMMSSGSRIMAFLILPMCCGTAALATELVPLLYGRAFSGAASSAAILILSSCLAGNTVIFTGLIAGKERSDFLFYLNSASAVLTLLLGYIFVQRLGIVGAALGRALVQVVIFAVSAWFVVYRLKFSLPFGQIFRLVCAAAACGLSAAAVTVWWPGLPGVLVASFVGAIVYFALVRLLGCLETVDIRRVEKLLEGLPRAIGTHVTTFVSYLAPPGR